MRIRAWDGSEAGPADGPVLVIRSRRALRRLLWAPGELGLARAYVTGDIDVEGDLADGFRRAWKLARIAPVQRRPLSTGRQAEGGRCRGPARRDRHRAQGTGVRGAAARSAAHEAARPRRDQRTTTTSPTTSTSCCSMSTWPTPRPTSRTRASRCTTRRHAKLDLDLPQARPQARHAAARRGLRLGFAHPARRRALRRARHRHHALGPAARLHRQAHRRPRPVRPRRGAPAGLPRVR